MKTEIIIKLPKDKICGKSITNSLNHEFRWIWGCVFLNSDRKCIHFKRLLCTSVETKKAKHYWSGMGLESGVTKYSEYVETYEKCSECLE